MAGSAHGVGTEARALPAALTMTSAPAVVSMAALAAREAPVGLVLPAEVVSAALAVWAAAPVLAEPGAAAAASAAWAAAAATAAEPDADADIMTKGKPHLTVGLPFCQFCYLMQLEQGL